MDLSKITLFALSKKRMDWLNQRQEVLSQNIANADSPGYRPQDLKKFKFKELIRRESMQLNMNVENPNHLGGRRKRIKDFAAEKERKPYETMPAGNAVVIEEQMHKVSETSTKHKITTELYKKHLGMFRTALGRS
ncbi:MAG: flagellar basal body rod protein FlgB [Rhodospirillales bacterium]